MGHVAQSGAGGQREPSCISSDAAVDGFSKGMVYGFAHFKVDAHLATVHLIQDSGEVLYVIAPEPRRKFPEVATVSTTTSGSSDSPSPPPVL